uniref:Ig-like domain-containing protein n=1 Tax=Poecilia mexicana TaxID=48701 RepID=A0A3B3YZ86_9TELE
MFFFFSLTDTRGGSVHFQFSKSGADVALSCKSPVVSFDCSAVRWLHYRGSTKPTLEIENGKVVQRSGRAARLSVDSRCSLIITNITAEDAGKYTCQLQGGFKGGLDGGTQEQTDAHGAGRCNFLLPDRFNSRDALPNVCGHQRERPAHWTSNH